MTKEGAMSTSHQSDTDEETLEFQTKGIPEMDHDDFRERCAALDAAAIATMPAPGTPIPAERCLSCARDSGGDWSQCQGQCPIPISPHYDPLFRAQMIAAARAIDANPPTHRWDFATAEAVKLTPTEEDDPNGERLQLDGPAVAPPRPPIVRACLYCGRQVERAYDEHRGYRRTICACGAHCTTDC
jgi:hypothetical protein